MSFRQKDTIIIANVDFEEEETEAEDNEDKDNIEADRPEAELIEFNGMMIPPIPDNDVDDLFESDPEPKQHIIEDVFQYLKPDIKPNTDFAGNTNLIKLCKIDLLRLFNLFEPNLNNLKSIIINVFHSPYKKEVIVEVVKKWYAQGNHDVDIVDNYRLDYRCTKTNEWFFIIISHLTKEQRNLILEKYFSNTVDDSERIDIKSNFLFTDLRDSSRYQKSNGGILVGKFLTDLRKVAAHIDIAPSIYLIKEQKGKLTEIKEHTFKTKLCSINLGLIQSGRKPKVITAWTIYKAENNYKYIMFKEMRFYDPNPEVFSIFQGYAYNELLRYEQKPFILYIQHIFRIICSGERPLFQYVISWLSYLFQKPNGKIGTALVITGEQGTGKTTFVQVICNLLGQYANDNSTIENITGRYNGVLENKKLIVCNEVKSFAKRRDHDVLKTLITESSVDVHKKYQNTTHQENVANFIFLSNNFAPIRIDEGDRRYFVVEISQEKRNDQEYFGQLFDSFTDEFYENLLTYFMQNDISRWIPSNIPMTRAKQMIIEYCKPRYKVFIQMNIEKFIKGFINSEAYNQYKKWCTNNNYDVGRKDDFRTGIMKFCDEQSHLGTNNTTITYYILTKDNYKYFKVGKLPDLIEID